MLTVCLPFVLSAKTTEILDRGPHHRTVQENWQYTNDLGQAVSLTNRWTELENGMHYWHNGQWTESEERIDPAPQGAVAQTGPMKVLFAKNINAPGSIDILTSDDQRLRLNPLALYYLNRVTGETVLLGSIQDATGEILPPNQVLYPDAFDNVQADVLYTYEKGAFHADVILKEHPPLPPGFTAEDTCLEVLTEFLDPPAPETTAHVLKRESDPVRRELMAVPDLVDHTLDFGQTRMTLGKAFLTDPSQSGTERNKSLQPVAKEWIQDTGRTFLIERVDYQDIEEELKTLAAKENSEPVEYRIAQNRFIPPRARIAKNFGPLVAVHDPGTGPRGLVLDFNLDEEYSTFTFAQGQTYCVVGTCHITDLTNIEPGAIIKYDDGAILKLSGEVNTPSSLPQAVLTSISDHTVGDVINATTQNLYISESNQIYAATIALDLFYVNAGTVFSDLQIRHAERAVQDYSPYGPHTFKDFRLVGCETGIGVYWTDTVVTNLVRCDVVTNVTDLGQSTSQIAVYNTSTMCDVLVNDPQSDLSIVPDTGGEDEFQMAQVESSMIINGSNIMVSFNDFSSQFVNNVQLTGYALSSDGGATFEDKGLFPATTCGDIGDSVLAFYNSGFAYAVMLANSCFEELTFFRSDDFGQSFDLALNSAPGFGPGNDLDKPWIAVDNNDGTGNGYIYQVVYNSNEDPQDPNDLLPGLYFNRSTDHGVSWENGTGVTNSLFCFESDLNPITRVANIAVAASHYVYVFYYRHFDTTTQNKDQFIRGWRSTDRGGSWNQITELNLQSEHDQGWFLNIKDGMGGIVRNTCNPQVVVRPGNGHIYMVYPDDPVDANDSSDVFLVRYYITRSGWVQDGPVRVNDDATTHDQWSPTIALSPDGNRLFIGFYDRRLDPQNVRIHTFGAIADIDQYGAFTLRPNFQISSVNFPPPDDIAGAMISDYDTAQADDNYFYYSWGDHRNIFLDDMLGETNVPNNEANIRFTKIANE